MAIQDKQVSEFLSKDQITFKVIYIAKVNHCGGDNFPSFQWSAVFTAGKTVEVFDYFMGIAHVGKTGKPSAPTAANVIHGLLLDNSALDQNFDDWCGDCGYDTDSRKSLSIYESCKAGAVKLKNIFSEAQLSELADMLADY